MLLMALRKDASRRYRSVDAFSDDIARHLSGLAVSARVDAMAYRAWTFAKRHRLGMAAASLILLTMSGAVAVTTWQARVASAESRRAEQQAAEARRQSERAERQTREAEGYRARAEREADIARKQLRIIEERTREADLRRREADLAQQRAERRARDLLAISSALLDLNATLPQVPGGLEPGRRAVDAADRSLAALSVEGFDSPSLLKDAAAARELSERYEQLRNNVTTGTPPGWAFESDHPNDYEHGLDRTYSAGGAAAYIRSRRANAQGVARLIQSIAEDGYEGRRIRVSASLRSNAIGGSGGILFRVIRAAGVATGNFRALTLRGTNEWRRHAVVFDVPEDAKDVVVGFGLSGPGAIWADDFSFEVVDPSTPLTRTLPTSPVDLDFDGR